MILTRFQQTIFQKSPLRHPPRIFFLVFLTPWTSSDETLSPPLGDVEEEGIFFVFPSEKNTNISSSWASSSSSSFPSPPQQLLPETGLITTSLLLLRFVVKLFSTYTSSSQKKEEEGEDVQEKRALFYMRASFFGLFSLYSFGFSLFSKLASFSYVFTPSTRPILVYYSLRDTFFFASFLFFFESFSLPLIWLVDINTLQLGGTRHWHPQNFQFEKKERRAVGVFLVVKT